MSFHSKSKRNRAQLRNKRQSLIYSHKFGLADDGADGTTNTVQQVTPPISARTWTLATLPTQI